MSKTWTVDESGRNNHNLTFTRKHKGARWVLLIADAHWDNPHCQRDLLKRHLDLALERDAPIISAGDFFCAMQGKYDRRSNKGDLRPEHQTGEYLDSLVSTATKWLDPYKENLILLGEGNHEKSICDRHETDLLDRLAFRLRERGGITRRGGYGGWVRLHVQQSTERYSRDLYYHHGFGGGGPVTRGMIDWSRYSMGVMADVFVAGHVHYQNLDKLPRMGLNRAGNLEKRDILFLRCGTYKDEFKDGYGGWHVEKGRGPRPLGGWWLKLNIHQKEMSIQPVGTE